MKWDQVLSLQMFMLFAKQQKVQKYFRLGKKLCSLKKYKRGLNRYNLNETVNIGPENLRVEPVTWMF